MYLDAALVLANPHLLARIAPGHRVPAPLPGDERVPRPVRSAAASSSGRHPSAPSCSCVVPCTPLVGHVPDPLPELVVQKDRVGARMRSCQITLRLPTTISRTSISAGALVASPMQVVRSASSQGLRRRAPERCTSFWDRSPDHPSVDIPRGTGLLRCERARHCAAQSFTSGAKMRYGCRRGPT
jgi:hypothetical protein